MAKGTLSPPTWSWLAPSPRRQCVLKAEHTSDCNTDWDGYRWLPSLMFGLPENKGWSLISVEICPSRFTEHADTLEER
jgi:hypothetical protein